MLGEVSTPVQGAALASAGAGAAAAAAGDAAGVGRFTGAQPANSTSITNPMIDNCFIDTLFLHIGNPNLLDSVVGFCG